MTVAARLRALLDGYGPPVPSLLPWLARTAPPDQLPHIARTAAAQAALAPALRWPAVADAVAEVLALRAADGSVPEYVTGQLGDILPQLAAHLDAALLGPMPRVEVAGYAALGGRGVDLLDQALRLVPTAPWPQILTAARTAVIPPLSNLRLLRRLATGDAARPGALDGSEAAYLLPYLPGGNAQRDLLGDVVEEIEDHLAAETVWYGAALLARAAPYLGEGERSRLRARASAAPLAWADLLFQLTGRPREPWPSTAGEVGAAHPAAARLIALTSQASDADHAGLRAEYARLTSQIMDDFGDPSLERWEPGGLGRGAQPGRNPAFGPVYIQPVPESPARDVPLGIVPDLRFAGEPPRPRTLVGECPQTVAVGKPFTLRAWIALGGSKGAALLPFDVPPGGSDVVLVVTTAPGIRVLGETSHKVHVPRDGDSAWAEFSLQADAPVPGSASVIATLDGTYLGALAVGIDARPDAGTGPFRRVRGEVGMDAVPGAVSLIARYSPRAKVYRFQLIADDYPSEVRHELDFDPEDSIRDLIRVLNDLAEGRRVYSPAKARRYLANKGAELWQNLLPDELRAQFWDHQAGIGQLTILSDKDVVPWEVLYPKDPGHGDSFLVEQFPVTRAIFDRSRVRGLRLRPARFVLPPRSPSKAAEEIATLCRLLGETSPEAEVTDYDQLLELLEDDEFGVLHFACHNTFDPVAGSAIKFGKTLFTPDDLTMIADDRVLADSAPLVFVNACQAAGLALSYNKLEGWATKFMTAGAAAFIGTLWAVADETSTPFAVEVYSELSKGTPLGQAVLAARRAVSGASADPTWLAYTVYGDPRATITSGEG